MSRILATPGEIVWVTLANVTDANREKHLELREKLFSIMINSPYVKVGQDTETVTLLYLGVLQVQRVAGGRPV